MYWESGQVGILEFVRRRRRRRRLEIWKSWNLEIWELGIKKIIEIKIRSAQHVRKVRISRKQNLTAFFQAISSILFHGPDTCKNHLFFAILSDLGPLLLSSLSGEIGITCTNNVGCKTWFLWYWCCDHWALRLSWLGCWICWASRNYTKPQYRPCLWLAASSTGTTATAFKNFIQRRRYAEIAWSYRLDTRLPHALNLQQLLADHQLSLTSRVVLWVWSTNFWRCYKCLWSVLRLSICHFFNPSWLLYYYKNWSIEMCEYIQHWCSVSRPLDKKGLCSVSKYIGLLVV